MISGGDARVLTYFTCLSRRLYSRSHDRNPGHAICDRLFSKPYLDAQVLRVWVVDSKATSITVFYPDAAPQTYRGDTLLKDALFDGLEFTAEQVFQTAKIPPTFF